MVEWDYAYIRIRIMFNLASGVRLFEGSPEQCWDYARRNGWELVSVDNGIAYFKRPARHEP
jgi:hypothetical protein